MSRPSEERLAEALAAVEKASGSLPAETPGQEPALPAKIPEPRKPRPPSLSRFLGLE